MWRGLVDWIDYLCAEYPNELAGTFALAVLLGMRTDSWGIGILTCFAIPALLVAWWLLGQVLKIVVVVAAWLLTLVVKLVAAIMRESV